MILKSSDAELQFKVVHLNERLKKHSGDFKRITKGLDASVKQSVGSKLTQIFTKTKKLTQKKQKTSRVFVLDFKGDVRAQQLEMLREEVSLILSGKSDGDQVILRLESPGGLVSGYGLAAAQLARLRDAGVKLTVCVDQVAASGGYMMACVADRIVSAPFAVTGSIGVVAQMPNFHRLLEKHQVDFTVYTAGEHKRSVTLFGKNSEEGEQKFQSELEHTHDLFKQLVKKYRSQLDLEKVANGDHWYGEDAINLGLVDELKTSDELLLEMIESHEIYEIGLQKKRSPVEKWLSKNAEMAINRVSDKLLRVPMGL